MTCFDGRSFLMRRFAGDWTQKLFHPVDVLFRLIVYLPLFFLFQQKKEYTYGVRSFFVHRIGAGMLFFVFAQTDD